MYTMYCDLHTMPKVYVYFTSHSVVQMSAVCGASVPEDPHAYLAASAAELHAPFPPAQAHALHGGEHTLLLLLHLLHLMLISSFGFWLPPQHLRRCVVQV